MISSVTEITDFMSIVKIKRVNFLEYFFKRVRTFSNLLRVIE